MRESDRMTALVHGGWGMEGTGWENSVVWLSVGRVGGGSGTQDETDVRMSVAKGVSFSQYL